MIGTGPLHGRLRKLAGDAGLRERLGSQLRERAAAADAEVQERREAELYERLLRG